MNDLNQLFVDIVRNSGGNNAKRHLLVEIYNTNLEYAYDPLFKMPNDPANRLALTVHYYTPANFAILGGGEVVDWGVGRESWGTEADFKELNDNMDLLKKNCVDKGIPRHHRRILRRLQKQNKGSDKTLLCFRNRSHLLARHVPNAMGHSGGTIQPTDLPVRRPSLLRRNDGYSG